MRHKNVSKVVSDIDFVELEKREAPGTIFNLGGFLNSEHSSLFVNNFSMGNAVVPDSIDIEAMKAIDPWAPWQAADTYSTANTTIVFSSGEQNITLTGQTSTSNYVFGAGYYDSVTISNVSQLSSITNYGYIKNLVILGDVGPVTINNLSGSVGNFAFSLENSSSLVINN